MAIYSRPTGATIVGVIHYIYGGLMVLAGLFLLLGGTAVKSISTQMESGMLGPLVGWGLTAVGVAALVMGALAIIIGVGVWHVKNWARIVATVFAVLGILSIFSMNIVSFAIGLLTIYFLWFHQPTSRAFAARTTA